MRDEMLHVMEWHNGEKDHSPFSQTEMTRRQDDLRRWMVANDVDAALFTSQHCITYFSGWLYRGFGRRYGMVIRPDAATTISPAIDGGQPWRRSAGGNISYTDWRRDNFFRAVRQLTAGVRRLGIECDHVSLDYRRALESALPGVDFVDIAQPAMWLRVIKSDEEQDLLRKAARIGDIGGRAVADAVRAGAPEHEVALAGTTAMTREIARSFPFVEPMESWTWVQSGVNTDGAHNPVTNRVIRSGDILSMNCYPMLFGYGTALHRTLFCDSVDDASRDIWEKNLAVHRRGLELIRPGARCTDIAQELNDLYRQQGLLRHRSFGYGHSVGVMSHHYGREAGLELREDCETVLKPGMVLSMSPMVMLPEGTPGAGGYREQDILIVTETGAETITGFPIGPDHNVLAN